MLRQLSRRTSVASNIRVFGTTTHVQRAPLGRYRAGLDLIQVKSRSTDYSSRTLKAAFGFHTTVPNQGLPLVGLLALKSATALELARTAARIVLTFVPVILLKNHKSRKYLKLADVNGTPATEEKKQALLKRIRHRTAFFHFLLAIPAVLFWAAIFASMERTPLTGRIRLIILSPEEEDEIAAQLAGPGWYNAVGEILAQDGSYRLIAPTDWRYTWVNETLRRLESTIPLLVQEEQLCANWLQAGPDAIPIPPPAEYPLRPRPRASEYLRCMCERMCEKRDPPPVPHTITGPPYNLLIVERPDALNAFSYGFGPDGGGGIVVYSGFIDDIMSRVTPEIQESQPRQSLWSSLLGGLFPQATPPPRHPMPNEQQTSQLAILLAHELAHLILSHHLETLSSATVIIPGTLSMLSDVIRVLIFPVTMLLGPFVNDAVAQLGKIGSGELVKIGEYCTSIKQEIEADVVSARLLAHAGFDARDAVMFWENRISSATECSHAESIDLASGKHSKGESLARRMTGSGHPVNEVRVDKLKSELVRWETERRAALARLQLTSEQAASNVNLIAA
ncbi:hypothetical protein K435DRAFT_962618 [Dendrothele bispora CBS 962.96]|uniref:Peptidase M48 domain-containing protein n=1 Tax=Dendrothele bispora (strain CBS 962.96) TaxID=1314807 RepID=A0A4S8MKD0_DENBC|nr:hypothetical protein K435DRAFT_962618 [Dendrothele bispora CBS 962.96]